MPKHSTYKAIKRGTSLPKKHWSSKYKKSINCSHPKGFSQKAHCKHSKKR
jgi:hypothetical protein|tara:strand:- start:6636 stop:6785 length:150 start_codon:yes stop_codon:yes gene_type:complete